MANEPGAAPTAPEKGGEPEPFNPSGIEGTVERFLQDQEAAKATSAAKETPPAPAAGTEHKGEPAPPERKPTLRLVNEKGELVLDRFKSDGKEILLEDAEALKTYLGFGYHHNQTGEDLKRREEALQKEVDAFKEANPMFGKVLTAIQEGRIRIVEPGEKPPAKGDIDPGAGKVDEEEDSMLDPATRAIKQELRETRRTLEELKVAHKELRDNYNLKEVDAVTKTLKANIEEAKKKYKFADDEQVWAYLAETGPDGKTLKYNEEQAVKLSHERNVAKFQEWLTAEHPELTVLSDSKKKEIIAEYLESKASSEAAPVGKPSGIPAAAPKPKEREFKSLSEAVQAGFADIAADQEAAKKH